MLKGFSISLSSSCLMMSDFNLSFLIIESILQFIWSYMINMQLPFCGFDLSPLLLRICCGLLTFILLCCMTSSSGGPAPLISPQSVSSEGSKKHSPRVVRQLKTSPRFLEPTISSSKLATKPPPKERSPRVSDHNSSSSSLSEVTQNNY